MPPIPEPIGLFDRAVREIAGFFLSPSWESARFVLQIFGGLLTAFLITAIIVLEVKSGFVYSKYRRKIKNLTAPLYPKKDRFSRDLARIDKYMESGDPKRINEAVLLADTLLDSVFELLGYPDDIMAAIEYFKNQLRQSEDLIEIHGEVHKFKTGNRVPFTKMEAERIVKIYRQSLQDLQVI